MSSKFPGDSPPAGPGPRLDLVAPWKDPCCCLNFSLPLWSESLIQEPCAGRSPGPGAERPSLAGGRALGTGHAKHRICDGVFRSDIRGKRDGRKVSVDCRHRGRMCGGAFAVQAEAAGPLGPGMADASAGPRGTVLGGAVRYRIAQRDWKPECVPTRGARMTEHWEPPLGTKGPSAQMQGAACSARVLWLACAGVLVLTA